MPLKKNKPQTKITKQSLFLSSLNRKLVEFDDPNPDIITHESYEYRETTLSTFGKIPQITFKPYGRNRQIKAEIMKSSGIYDPAVEKEIAKIRVKYNPKQANIKEATIQEKRFDSYWNAYWKSNRRSLKRINQANKLFITNQSPNSKEQISKPMQILMGIKSIEKTEEQKQESKSKDKSKSYMDELMEVE